MVKYFCFNRCHLNNTLIIKIDFVLFNRYNTTLNYFKINWNYLYYNFISIIYFPSLVYLYHYHDYWDLNLKSAIIIMKFVNVIVKTILL